MDQDDEKIDISKWKPHGKICLKCGAPNPDGHDICGGCGEEANDFKEGNLTKKQQEEREVIKQALK